MNRVGLQPPRVGWRVAVTVAVLLLCGVSVRAISMLQGPVEGPLAVRQIEDNPVDYSVGRAAAVTNIPAVIELASAVVVLAVWISFALQYAHYRRQSVERAGPGNSV